MKFQINVYGSPWSTQTAEQAQTFAKSVLANGHELNRIFFFFDGVYHGLKTQAPASDEPAQLEHWQELKRQGVDLILCIAASANRGLLNEEEAQRYDKDISTVDSAFELSGLGQWASGFHDADRIVSFK